MIEARPACAGKTGLFFSDNRHDRIEAVRICQGCPLLESCRERVLLSRTSEFGVWGGLNEEQRDLERFRLGVQKRRARAVCASEPGYRKHLRLGEEPCVECRAAHAVEAAARRAAQRAARVGLAAPVSDERAASLRYKRRVVAA